jgi:hypothetical protein
MYNPENQMKTIILPASRQIYLPVTGAPPVKARLNNFSIFQYRHPETALPFITKSVTK